MGLDNEELLFVGTRVIFDGELFEAVELGELASVWGFDLDLVIGQIELLQMSEVSDVLNRVDLVRLQIKFCELCHMIQILNLKNRVI